MLVGPDGSFYFLEINARLNMSTYQGGVVEHSGRTAGLARHYTLRLDKALAFDQIRAALDRVRRPEETDVVVTCFGTVNAAAGAASVTPASTSASAPFDGRLYVMLFAPDPSGLTGLDVSVQRELAAIPGVLEVR